MNYTVTDIENKDLSDDKLKEIINKKIYKIIEFMEFNINVTK